MRVNCVICTDLFISSSDVSVTECGHMFHSHCIFQWLERSKTCPQCRRKTQEKKLVKIFLDCCEAAGDGPEPSQLQNELESLRFKLSLKTSEARKAVEEMSELKEQHTGLREEVKKLEKVSRAKDDTVTAMKMQLQCFGDIARDKQRAMEERDKLKAKLRLLSNVDAVVSQSTAQVSAMLAAYSFDETQAAKDMATYCLMLKKELTRSVEERRKYSDDRHQLRAQVQAAKVDSQRLQRRLEKLTSLNSTLDAANHSLEEENERLRKQVNALQAAVVSPSGDPKNSALTRLLSENTTPAEWRSRPARSGTADAADLPTPEHNAGLDGDQNETRAARPVVCPGPSPQLRVKSAPVCAPLRPAGSRMSRNPFSATAPSNVAIDCSRLKGKNLLTENVHRSDFAARAGGSAPGVRSQAVKRRADHGWDGFGGSSKPDIFPVAQPKLKIKLKNGGQVMRIDNFFTS